MKIFLGCIALAMEWEKGKIRSKKIILQPIIESLNDLIIILEDDFVFLLVMEKEFVILVNEKDEQIGLMEKIEAHQKALLHRAFSVFVYDSKGRVMMQKRAEGKYHSPGLWTNTCCSHPREGETLIEAGKRRLQEEMGFVTDLEKSTSFIYKAPFDNGLTEHELDHILIGNYEGVPQLNPDEVADWKWMGLEEIRNGIKQNPEQYTAWFKIIFEKYYDFIS